MPVVVDASITVAWCFDDEAAAFDDAVLYEVSQSAAFVPAIWPYEMANFFVGRLRSGRMSKKDLERILVFLDAIPIVVEQQAHSVGELVDVAQESGLTSYDASYLVLARQQEVAIASKDKAMVKAARELGIETFAA